MTTQPPDRLFRPVSPAAQAKGERVFCAAVALLLVLSEVFSSNIQNTLPTFSHVCRIALTLTAAVLLVAKSLLLTQWQTKQQALTAAALAAFAVFTTAYGHDQWFLFAVLLGIGAKDADLRRVLQVYLAAAAGGLLAVQLLTLSDRVQHNHEVILPALREGKVVICDRYLYTSVANMRARGYWRERWFFAAARSIRKPDLTFLAYVPPACAIARIRSRPEECSRHLNEALLSAAAREFLKLKKSEGFTLIDTETDAERAFASVREKLDELMEKKR